MNHNLSMAMCNSTSPHPTGTKYLLDTSVASLILDGNCGRGSHLLLWTTRKICRLNYFMVENLVHLRASHPRSNPWVGASMHAWKWAELVPPNSIYITPTVLNELIISPRVLYVSSCVSLLSKSWARLLQSNRCLRTRPVTSGQGKIV